MDMYISQNVQAPETFPEIGFIVRDDQGKAIAAGFLRKVEGNVAQMDSFVTNSTVLAEIRHNAIDLLTQTIIATTKNLNLSGLIVITQIQSIADRAVKQGFVINPDIVLGLKLD
jgi:hypothetical protein